MEHGTLVALVFAPINTDKFYKYPNQFGKIIELNLAGIREVHVYPFVHRFNEFSGSHVSDIDKSLFFMSKWNRS